MKRMLLLCCLLSSLATTAQTVAGLWRGRFTSNDPLQRTTSYKYELLLFQDGNKLTGYSYSTLIDGQYYGVCEVTGTVFTDYFVVTEKKTVYQNPPGDGGVLQSHILFFNAGQQEASGEWKQANKRATQLFVEEGKTFMKKEEDPSTSGLIKVLERNKVIESANTTAPKPTLNQDSIKLASREKNIVRVIETSADSISIELYDDGLIDGDSVSVFLNQSILVTKVALSDKGLKKTLSLTTDEPTILTLFAENEGTVPPNTGVLIIRDADKRYEIRFTSDTRKSAAIEIRRK
jgi:hypothetical protein